MSLRNIVVFMAALFVSVSGAEAQEDVKRRIAEFQRAVKSHVAEAEELKKAGKEEAAQEHMQRAKQIERHIEEMVAEHKQAEQNQAEHKQRRDSLAELKRAIESHVAEAKELKKAGDEEAAAQHMHRAEQIERHIKEMMTERDKQQGEVAELRRALESHIAEAKELERAGEKEAAARHMHRAEQIERRIKEMSAGRGRRPRPDEGMSRAQVISALKRGVTALKTIDRHEEAHHLTNILEEYAGRGRRRERTKPADKERQVAAETIEIMQLAHGWLAESGREKAADQMEHVIHGRKLILGGKREGEAAEVIRSMPSRGQQIELLEVAAKLMAEHGKGEKAQVVRQLADSFRRPRDGDRRGTRERDHEREEARRHERRESEERRERTARERPEQRDNRAQEERIRRLEDQIRDLRRAIERLHKQRSDR